MSSRSRMMFALIALIVGAALPPVAVGGQPATSPTWFDAMDGVSPLLTEDSPDESRFTYIYTGGQYKIQAHATDFSGDLFSYISVGTLTDSATSVSVFIEDDRIGKYAFVGCRAGDQDDGYALEVHTASGTVRLWALIPGNAQLLAEGNASAAISPGGGFNTIDIECYQQLITGKVNGQVVVSEFDATFAAGFSYIGGGVQPQAPSDLFMVFDDLAVSDLSRAATDQLAASTAIPTLQPQATVAAQSVPQLVTGSSFDQIKAAALTQSPVAGPVSQTLVQSSTDFPWIPAGVDLYDLFVSATFVNPMNTSMPWDIGLAIRYGSADTEARIIIESSGTWSLSIGSGTLVAHGQLSGLATGPGALNTIEVAAQGSSGSFAVNGQVIADLDLSESTQTGDVFASTGFFVANAVDGRELVVQDYAVWALPVAASVSSGQAAVTGNDPAATFDQLRSAALATSPLAGPLQGAMEQQAETLSYWSANVNVADVYVAATFQTPSDGSLGWDVGLGIRQGTDSSGVRLILEADGDWFLAFGLDPVSDAGSAGSLNVQPGASNTIELVAHGAMGYLAINGVFAGTLDLSPVLQSGDVLAGTGFFPNSTVTGRSIGFSGFQVWELPATT
ncbi:MAG: hypothetical protein KF883_00030 [Thermomicrobiales bacterium]|nr:hypothetical protein [Thermomicrobiales bacterium]